MNKRLRFAQNLVPLILSGDKLSTWRLWDDKDLTVGDVVDFIEYGADKHFTTGKITEVIEKPLGKLTEKDKKGHEKFNSDEKMYQTYTKYYGRTVDKNTLVKIIRFELMPCIDRIALIDIKNNKILLALSKNKDTWFIPGGKREKGETDEVALVREIKEELSVDIILDTITYFTTLEGDAHGMPKGTRVRIAFYTGKYTGDIKPEAEIDKVNYFSFENAPKLAETGKVLLQELKTKGVIN